MGKGSGKAGKAGKAPQATENTEAETATEQPKAEKPKQPSANGITRPKSGTATGRVWEIADKLSADKGEPAARGDVMAAAKAEGLNEATIATQYGRWRKFFGLGRAKPVAAAAVAEDAPEVEEQDEDTPEIEDEDEDEEE